MRLLIIEPGLKLWGSERAFLSSLPALIPAYEKLVVMAPPESELVAALPSSGVSFEPAAIDNLHRRSYLARIKVMFHILRLCRQHKIDKIYLNQAGLCRIVHQVARLLKLPSVIHVRLVEDIPRCSALTATSNAPIDLIFVSHDMHNRYPEPKTGEPHKRLFVAYDPYELGGVTNCMADRPYDLTCVGRLAVMKGQVELIEAVAHNCDRGHRMDLHVIGTAADGDPYAKRLAIRTKELELQDVVSFLGYRSDATQYMRLCKLVAVPSHYEPLGRVVYEAWEAGAMPLCSRDCGGAAEMLAASQGGVLYDGHQPEAVAGALREANALSKTERCIRIDKGRQWARENLSLAAYRNALAGVLFPVSEMTNSIYRSQGFPSMTKSNPVHQIGQKVLNALPPIVASTLRAAKRSILNRRSTADVFKQIYTDNVWDGTESVSGPGSTLTSTENIRKALPKLIDDYGIKSILDIPCGDAYWIGECQPPNIAYTGGDIVPELIKKNQREKANLGKFIICNLVTDPLPQADLILVRDCFIHLPNSMVKQAIKNIKSANIRYILTTTFPTHGKNIDIELGGYRPVDMEHKPFSFPPPKNLITENEAINGNNKSLALWVVAELP